MTFVSQMAEPNLFFWTQLLTFGGSDLRDFSIVYMSGFESFLYFALNTIDMTINYPFAFFWTSSLSLIYVITGIVELFTDSGQKGEGKGGKGG